jgi:hypothetical protein
MSPGPRRNPVIGIAAATLGVAAGVAAGIAADRAGRHRAAMAALEMPELLDIVPDEEHVVLTSDGVALHCEVDLPEPEVAAAAAEGATRTGRIDELPTIVLTHGYCLSLRCWVYQRRVLKASGSAVTASRLAASARATPSNASARTSAPSSTSWPRRATSCSSGTRWAA